MRMNLDVTESPEVKVLISNPDVPALKQECNEATIDGYDFYFELESFGLYFNGALYGDCIRGEMQQHGVKWMVTFTRE